MRNLMRAPLGALAVVVAMATSACSHQAAFNAEYFQTEDVTEALQEMALPQATVEGGAAVAMSQEVETAVVTANPDSFTGSATKLSVPVALIVKEAVAVSFADVMTEGAVTTSDAEAPAGQDYVVTPSVTNFSYKYDSLSTVGFAITPRVSLGIHIEAVNAAGETVFSQDYAEVDFAYGSYVASGAPGEKINRALHLLARRLTAQAASDFAVAMAARTPPMPAAAPAETPVAAAAGAPGT